MITSKKQLLYEPSCLEAALTPEYETPQRGFHTLHERGEISFVEGGESYRGSVTYVEGGANCGIRYTFVIVQPSFGSWEKRETGWAVGFRLPVPIRAFPPTLGKDIRGLEARRELLFPEEVPGFGEKERASRASWWVPPEGESYHQDGWYTTSVLVREIPTPEVLGAGARVYLLREGVYVAFPDGSSRLASYEDFFGFAVWNEPYAYETPRSAPTYRQGDLLVWERLLPPGATLEDAGPEHLVEFDRHQVRVPMDAQVCENGHTRIYCTAACVSHPEHRDLVLGQLPVLGVVYCIELLPGTSRPFERAAGLD